MQTRIRCLSLMVSALMLLGIANIAAGQNWPTKPVRFVVPFPPGGSVDPLARLLAVRVTGPLGQPVVVENHAGASGSIGAALVAKAPPDGYTFLFVFDSHAVNPFLIPNLPFDTAKDLAPVMLIGTAPMAIATHPSKPYRNFDDVIKAAKAKPDSISYGSIGSGSLGHLTMTLLQETGSFKVIHIPYKGGGPLSQDLLGNQVDLGIASVAVIAPHAKAGKMRAIAVTGDKRSATLPDVPALSEAGFPGFSALAWWGVFAPAGTPRPIVDRLNSEFAKALKQPDLNRQLTDQLGLDIVSSSPDALQKFLLEQMARWAKVVKQYSIKGD